MFETHNSWGDSRMYLDEWGKRNATRAYGVEEMSYCLSRTWSVESQDSFYEGLQ